MIIPSGAKKDLLVINLAIGLISIVIEDTKAVKEDKDLTKRTNKHYNLNKRIDRRLEKLVSDLKSTQDKVFKKYGADGSLGKWIKSKLDSKIVNILNGMEKDTNLELLANQILFECFMERDKPVIQEYEWLKDFKSYSVFDLLIETEAGNVTEETYEESIEIVRKLRC